MNKQNVNILWFNEISMHDVAIVGGKNASLGEMINNLAQSDVKVPNGFATTAQAFQRFINQDQLRNKILNKLETLNVENIQQLKQVGQSIRELILNTPFLEDFKQDVEKAYHTLMAEQNKSVAVRSSATAEDLPEASFAGQQETVLNVNGIDHVFKSIKEVFASLYNDRAIAYRVHQQFNHDEVSLSAGIQLMVRSDIGSAGVMFTIDTESGFNDAVFITGSYGLGECVVQGSVNPDEFYVYKKNLRQQKPSIIRRHLGSKTIKMIYNDDKNANTTTKIVDIEKPLQLKFCIPDEDIEILGQYALAIEDHYQRPMDIEWAKDGNTNEIFILQARPETVESRKSLRVIERYEIIKTAAAICQGRAIGQKAGQGKAKIIKSIAEMDQVKKGDVLITDMTDPDWEPVMKRASAIVTNRGGRTCHAAIIARELGIPAVVGCNNATTQIQHNSDITVSCAEGDTGYIYEGMLDIKINTIDLENIPELPVKIMMNVAHPDRAFLFQSLPNEGIGLARIEFIIANNIGIHPKALLNFDKLQNEVKQNIADKISAYPCPKTFFVEKLCEGISTLACSVYPKPIIIRLSDFKSNEYAKLLGGEQYEPHEENPMLGFRGASRYVAPIFKDCFALECQALIKAREEMGFDNIQIMVPFVRTVDEAKEIINILQQQGLERGKNGLKIIMMCEIPANALLAEEFLQYFDGFSIGSNDMTQMALGLDRDSSLVAKQFDERNPAVKKLLSMAIQACKKQNKYIGICGQGPSDHRDFAKWLLDEGIDSMSLNPDSVLETFLYLNQQLSH